MNCPRCSHLMTSGTEGTEPVWYCPFCEESYSAVNRQPKLPHLDRGRQAVTIERTEAQIVQGIRRLLLAKGYMVWRTGQLRADWAGNDKGLPDVLLRRPQWRCGEMLGIEVKTRTGRTHGLQAQMVETEQYAVARSEEEAWQIVQDYEEERRG